MSSTLIYKPRYVFSTNIISMGINESGTRLAAITHGGFINIWNIDTGEQYFPVLGPEKNLDGRIIWLDDTAFICGFQRGHLLVCYVESDDERDISLTVTKRNILNDVALTCHITCDKKLAYDQSLRCLAISTHHSVQLWLRDAKDWKFHGSLSYPTTIQPHTSNQLVCVTSIAWIPNKNQILATYMNNDIKIWDFDSLSICCTVKSWASSSIKKSEILANSSLARLVTTDTHNMLDVYDIASGVIWSPSIALRVFALKSVHRGTTCVLGSNGKSELLDIEIGLITQVLDQDDGEAQVNAVAGHQNADETEFTIATASAGKCIVWKSEAYII